MKTLEKETVAITGATGGLGREIAFFLAEKGADIIMLDRNKERSLALREEIISRFPEVNIKNIRLDLTDIENVKEVTETLKSEKLYAIIHNAGAYKIPRVKCSTGYDNVFQINFLSPYYMTKELIPSLRENGGRVVVVGSIAHNYSKTDETDVDFKTRDKCSLVYGNAKRYLMFSLYRLFEKEVGAKLSVTHPGITLTGITSHYPKIIFALIKHPMKVIFMSPKKAARSIIEGLFTSTGYCEWIGPRFFNIWGNPSKKKLSTVGDKEIDSIFQNAEKAYEKIKSQVL